MKRISSRLTLFTVFLTLIVVVLGAYTRLTDSGLGCPDWPGCYQQLIVPSTAQSLEKAMRAYPNVPLHPAKAWKEMIHRYAAGILAITICAVGIMAIRRRKVRGQPVAVPVILMALVIFQALLGKWTVTLQVLPLVVMSHLLGGLMILALLWWMTLKTGNYFSRSGNGGQEKLKVWAVLGLVMVFLQIALGGWTSSNYAALACPDFPYCKAGVSFPQVDFYNAFNFFSLSNAHLSHAALITIQMAHRIGALFTGIYLGILAFYLIFKKHSPIFRKLGLFLFFILALQIILGALNVVWLLPLSVALLHNAVAAVLLLTLVTLVYLSFKRKGLFFYE